MLDKIDQLELISKNCALDLTGAADDYESRPSRKSNDASVDLRPITCEQVPLSDNLNQGIEEYPASCRCLTW